MIVIDVGCAPQGPERSIEKLIARFLPRCLYGFDPALPDEPYPRSKYGCQVVLFSAAAWTRTGTLEFAAAGIDGTVMRDKNTRGEWDAEVREVPCLDLGAFIRSLPDDETVLKFDAEGAEVPLLEHLHVAGMDERLTLLLVEWHSDAMAGDYAARRAMLEQSLRCPIEIWE